MDGTALLGWLGWLLHPVPGWRTASWFEAGLGAALLSGLAASLHNLRLQRRKRADYRRALRQGGTAPTPADDAGVLLADRFWQLQAERCFRLLGWGVLDVLALTSAPAGSPLAQSVPGAVSLLGALWSITWDVAPAWRDHLINARVDALLRRERAERAAQRAAPRVRVHR